MHSLHCIVCPAKEKHKNTHKNRRLNVAYRPPKLLVSITQQLGFNVHKIITLCPLYFALNVATTLTSSVDGRRTACPGERVTYTCTVTERLILEWTAEPFIIHSNRLQFTSTAPPEDRVLACSDPTSPVQCTDFDYHATLTSVSTIRNGFADMISTFMFTASARVNGTVLHCRGLTATEDQMASSILNVTGGLHTQCEFKCVWCVHGSAQLYIALNPDFLFQITTLDNFPSLL